MERVRISSVLALAVALTATACDKDGPRSDAPIRSGSCAVGPSDPVAYIPSDAVAIFSLDIDEVVDFEKEVVGDSVIEEAGYDSVLEAMAACGLRQEDFRSFTVAVASEEDELIGILEGESLGDEVMLRCLARELGSGSEFAQWAMERHGCDLRFVSGAETVGFAASNDTLVFASPRYLTHARRIMLGADPNPPRALVKNIKTKKTASFGGDLTAYVEDFGHLPVLGGLRTVTGFVDLDAGFELEVEGTYDSRAAADASAHELESLRRRGRMIAPEFGIPARVLDRVSIRHRGTAVVVAIDLDRKDVRRLTDAIKDAERS